MTAAARGLRRRVAERAFEHKRQSPGRSSDPPGLSVGMTGFEPLLFHGEQVRSPSTIKSSIAPLVRVLDEAVRDDVLASNPARNSGRRPREHAAGHGPHRTADLCREPRTVHRCPGAWQPTDLGASFRNWIQP